MPKRLASLLLTASLAACDAAPDVVDDLEGTPRDSGGVLDGTPQAAAVLLLANTLSETELDVDVPLDRRVARNIVKHRLGHDLLPGTADDDLFDDILELDAVPYLGASAFQALLAYAIAHDLVTSECSSDSHCPGGGCVHEVCMAASDQPLAQPLLGYFLQSLRAAIGPAGLQVASVSASAGGSPGSMVVRLFDQASDSVAVTDRYGLAVPLADSEGAFETFTGVGDGADHGVGAPGVPLVCVGTQPVQSYAIGRSAGGEVMVAIDRADSSVGPERLTLCRQTPQGWQEDLVLLAPGGEPSAVYLRFDQAERPELLRVVDGKLLRFRRLGFDTWLSHVLASDVVPSSLRVAQAGLVTHVFYTRQPTGNGLAQQRYLAITDDGVVHETGLFESGSATLLDVVVDPHGNAHALYRNPAVGGRTPLTSTRMTPDFLVSYATLASPEDGLASSAALAVDTDGSIYVVYAAGGWNRSGTLRTIRPQ